MNEVKILTKLENVLHDEKWAIPVPFTFNKFVSKEKDMEILVIFDHPKIKELEEVRISFFTGHNVPVEKDENYSYEISFVDDERLLKKFDNKNVREEDKHKRVFFHKNNITIKDNSYSAKIEQLKNQTNLMKEEIRQWEGFINVFRSKVADIEDKNSTKYKESKKFIEELEAELNKKTGKDNDDSKRERERERERERQKLPNWSPKSASWRI